MTRVAGPMRQEIDEICFFIDHRICDIEPGNKIANFGIPSETRCEGLVVDQKTNRDCVEQLEHEIHRSIEATQVRMDANL